MKHNRITLAVAILALAATLASTQLASAALIIASFDSAARQAALTTSPTNANDARLPVGPVDGSADYFRTYLTFNLTSETAATTVSLTLFDANANENNTSPGTSLFQNFTLFRVASDWDNASPLPLGTNLATVGKALGADASGNVTFSSAALTSAFNAAVGGTLYLGIYSPEGEAATDASNTRAFQWFRSVNGASALAGEAPTLTYTAVPEPSSALLGVLGVLCLLRRR